jgi:hypothetical protein
MGAPILESPYGGGDESPRNKLLKPYFHDVQPNQVVVILKSR